MKREVPQPTLDRLSPLVILPEEVQRGAKGREEERLHLQRVSVDAS